MAAARRRWTLGPRERAHVRGGRGRARASQSLLPLPLGARGARARGTVRDRTGTDPVRRRGRSRRRRRGPVGIRAASRFRVFRYEVRRWREGVIPDVDEAADSPQHLGDDLDRARRLLSLVPRVPVLVWGRDELRAGEMWNSNSIIAWLITPAGFDVDPAACCRPRPWLGRRRHHRSSWDGR